VEKKAEKTTQKSIAYTGKNDTTKSMVKKMDKNTSMTAKPSMNTKVENKT
jgi:hypothetical protein